MTTHVIRRGLTTPVSFNNVRTLILLLALLILFGAIYVGQSTQATLSGQRVQDLQERLDRLNRENAQLQYEIAVSTTPARIAERARALGLRPATSAQMVFLTVKNYPFTVAQAAPRASSQIISSSSSDSPMAAWWNDFLARLGLSPSPQTVQATASP